MSDKPRRTIDEIIKQINHPLEDHFDIERGTTQLTIKERHTELVQTEQYDEKDNEIESDMQEIADVAMDLVAMLKDEIVTSEPKFRARLTEVAGQHLNTALSAISMKARMKSAGAAPTA